MTQLIRSVVGIAGLLLDVVSWAIRGKPLIDFTNTGGTAINLDDLGTTGRHLTCMACNGLLYQGQGRALGLCFIGLNSHADPTVEQHLELLGWLERFPTILMAQGTCAEAFRAWCHSPASGLNDAERLHLAECKPWDWEVSQTIEKWLNQREVQS